MTLTLKIVNRTSLENGSKTELVLNNRGATIGRSMTCEWCLPDDTKTLSGKHCEIQYRQDDYFLVDHGSTNGTFLGSSEDRLAAAHKFAPGDRFRIGPYMIEARMSGAALDRHAREQELAAAAERGPDWVDWDDVPGSRKAEGAAAPSTPEDDLWDLPGEAPERVSAWSEDANASSNDPSARDIFGEVVATNEVDWSNASWAVEDDFDPFATDPVGEDGFAPLPADKPKEQDSFEPLPEAGQPASDPFAPMSPAGEAAPAPASAPPPSSDPFGAPLDGQPSPGSDPWPSEPAERTAPPTQPAGGFDSPPVGVPDKNPAPPTDRTLPPSAQTGQPPTHETVPPPAAATPTPAPGPDAAYVALLTELGVASSHVTIDPDEAAAKAGRMLRHLLAGLMILLEARARAKDEMGAAATQLRFDGNNPLKFARNVDQALQMMLNPKMRGYMEAEEAIEDSYRDLQAHQIATLKAMQGALRETLNRFSPASIKARTKEQGLLAKVLPGQREAAMWKAYEEQFSGVAEGSAEAFLEVFSKEFRKAYEEATHSK